MPSERTATGVSTVTSTVEVKVNFEQGSIMGRNGFNFSKIMIFQLVAFFLAFLQLYSWGHAGYNWISGNVPETIGTKDELDHHSSMSDSEMEDFVDDIPPSAPPLTFFDLAKTWGYIVKTIELGRSLPAVMAAIKGE